METLFISHLRKLVAKEKNQAMKSEKELLLGRREDLIKKGIAIFNLMIIENVTKKNFCSITLRSNGVSNILPKHKLLVGDLVQIQRYGRAFNPDDDENVGSISYVGNEIITISFSRNIFIQDLCNIGKFPSSETYKRMFEALDNVRMNLTTYNHLLSTTCAPRHSILKNYDLIDDSLDHSQAEAVKFSVGSDKITLIHGPPGKTHTLVEIIRQLVENQKLKVLVCAPSNTAVDNLLLRLMPYTNINTLRIGNSSRIAPEALCRTLESLANQRVISVDGNLIPMNQMDKLSDLLVSLNISDLESNSTYISKVPDQLFREANVVFSTLNGSGGTELKERRFDVVIIDEAGQATEPDCWIAITKSNKTIMCGDHLQLAPTVISSSNKEYGPKPKGMSVGNDLSYSLFDRLLDMHGGKIKTTLTVQYRMHENIMKFSSEELYKNMLTAHSSVKNHLLRDLRGIYRCESTASPLIFIDTSDSSTYHETEKRKKGIEKSSSNDMEVLLVEKHIELLLRCNLQEKHIGVITPYTAQVFNLRDTINSKWKDIEVNSIDGYQGREKECIIISMVRSNKRGLVGFLSDKRRLNVAMTRARRQLVVIGDSRTLLCEGRKTSEFSPFNRDFLIKWIKWLEEMSIKHTSQKYLNL